MMHINLGSRFTACFFEDSRSVEKCESPHTFIKPLKDKRYVLRFRFVKCTTYLVGTLGNMFRHCVLPLDHGKKIVSLNHILLHNAIITKKKYFWNVILCLKN